MIAILIPFFLVARIAVDEHSWKYGPEYVFEVQVNFSASPKATQDWDKEMGTFLSADLFCRPKMTDSLACRLSNTTALNFDNEISNEDVTEEEEEEEEEEKKPFDVTIIDEPFEIMFNNRGIESLIVNKSTLTERLNMMRSIVDQFSIGADLNSKPDEKFVTTQNFTVGECDVRFEVRHYPSKSLVRKTRNKIYDLESLAQLNKIPGEAVDIEKTKNLNNCSRYAPYYFGSYGMNTDNEKFQSHVIGHSMGSVSRIQISDTIFTSTTVNTGMIGSRQHKKMFHVKEITSVTLKDIRAANGPLPEVPNPGRTSITANSEIRSM